MPDDMTAPILARATINLPGFPFGETRMVNPASAYVIECLERGYLVIEPTRGEE